MSCLQAPAKHATRAQAFVKTKGIGHRTLKAFASPSVAAASTWFKALPEAKGCVLEADIAVVHNLRNQCMPPKIANNKATGLRQQLVGEVGVVEKRNKPCQENDSGCPASALGHSWLYRYCRCSRTRQVHARVARRRCESALQPSFLRQDVAALASLAQSEAKPRLPSNQRLTSAPGYTAAAVKTRRVAHAQRRSQVRSHAPTVRLDVLCVRCSLLVLSSAGCLRV